ncbi:hypothetical protein CAP47_07090 [Psychroflexus sp. S27]|uniref:hypothetical protein n=1 Tax=Psychroflexus sp. S27 TaxID=1982757 RepID=UPI000C29620D|nr:hypothetical protein [Psychroflexus sp. S27]PJX22784.1 hypothetical protein CAP47_07090 [Psychroflexus sp. S27]
MKKKKGENKPIPNSPEKNDETHKVDENPFNNKSDNTGEEEPIDLPPLPENLNDDQEVIEMPPSFETKPDSSPEPPDLPELENNQIDDTTTNQDDGEAPPDINVNKIEYTLEYNDESSYLFIFGPGSSGKTVLISSILYYLDSTRSVNYGDTLKNLNDPSKKHEREGNKLWKELKTTLFDNKFPRGTAQVQVSNPFPRHINAHFEPANKELNNFQFCLMDMAGEDLHSVDYESEESLPDSIRVYIEQMPKSNICFVYVLDPNSDIYEKSEQLSIFSAFIDLLDKNDHTETPLLFLVTKWDTIEDNYNDVEEYIKSEYPPIWGKLNQQARDISYSKFSIGKVNEDNDEIKKYSPEHAEKVFNWFYKKQTGSAIVGENKKRRGFLKRFKF